MAFQQNRVMENLPCLEKGFLRKNGEILWVMRWTIMPVIQVEILEGRTVEQKRAMAEKVTEVICETLVCPPESVTIVIREIKREHLAKGGKLALDK